MGQVRIGWQRVSAGSAARQAEEEAKVSGASRPMRVEAGSAARAAEEAKRFGLPSREGATSFTLRAQGGRVVRTAALPKAQTPSASETAADLHQSSQAPNGSVNKTCSVDVSPGISPPRASPPHSGVGRLKSFLRGFFLPNESPNP